MQQRTEHKAALCRLFTTKVRIMGPRSWYYFFMNRRNQRRLTVRSQLKVPLFIVYVQAKILTFYWTYDTMLKKHSGRRLNVCRSRGAYLCLSIFQSTSGQVRPDDTAIIVAKLFPFCKRKMLRQRSDVPCFIPRISDQAKMDILKSKWSRNTIGIQLKFLRHGYAVFSSQKQGISRGCCTTAGSKRPLIRGISKKLWPASRRSGAL